MTFGEYKIGYYIDKDLQVYSAGDILHPGVLEDHYHNTVWLTTIMNRWCPEWMDLNTLCRCGVWGYKTAEDLARAERGCMVVTQVRLDGNVLEYENGYIAERGILQRILIVSPRLENRFGKINISDSLWTRYQVPIEQDLTFWSRSRPEQESSDEELFQEWKRERKAEEKH